MLWMRCVEQSGLDAWRCDLVTCFFAHGPFAKMALSIEYAVHMIGPSRYTFVPHARGWLRVPGRMTTS